MISQSTTDFVNEAERRLRLVRNAILMSRQEGRSADLVLQVEEMRGLIHLADEMQLGTVSASLRSIETAISSSSVAGTMTDACGLSLLDLVSRAEAEVIKIGFSDETMIDLNSLIDESFNFIQIEPGVEDFSTGGQIEPEAEEEDEFEPDEEMLEIFAIEADELLANIESNLNALTASPADREALWEVRRHAHTFKGAAGIIGLKKPSKLAHRIEDLLDHLAQNEIVPNSAMLELIKSASVCLRVMTTGDNSPQIAARVEEIYEAFEKTMLSLTEGGEPEVMDAVVAVTDEAGGAPPADSENSEPIPVELVPRRPIVRVSINRLDELVHIVRDLVVSRSAVEQRITDLERYIEDLVQTTRRLQAANARIENDFEASMLGSSPAASFVQPSHSPFRADLNGGDDEEFDTLEFDRYTDFHESSRELSEAIQCCFSLGTALEGIKGTLDAVIDDQRRLIEETQEKVMAIRLIRFESIVTRLQRAVRVTCEETDRMAEIVVENQDVELDTDVLDSLVEPLMHLIRNAVAHGIEPPDMRRLLGKPETGVIRVQVANEDTHIELKVSDDGRGIGWASLRQKAVNAGLIAAHQAESLDADGMVSLLFMPGLTTAEKLTMSAGRGVGMSIIKESIQARGGTISVETAAQKGTTFTVKVPLAFAVTQALLVRSGRCLAAVPLKAVKRIAEFSSSDIKRLGSETFIEADSSLFPIRYLAQQFSQPRPINTESIDALLIENADVRFALAVDEILRTEEIAIKPLDKPLDAIGGLLGAAVLGNGEVTPVLNVSSMLNMHPHPQFETQATAPEPEEVPPFVLVVDDSPSVRHMTSKVMTNAGRHVVTAKDGVEAMEILGRPEKPGVILTDVEMPRMDGYELAAAVKRDETLCQIPVVFITSRAGKKHRERAAELGITEYLTKPFVEAELIGTVDRLTAVPV